MGSEKHGRVLGNFNYSADLPPDRLRMSRMQLKPHGTLRFFGRPWIQTQSPMTMALEILSAGGACLMISGGFCSR